MVDNICEPLMVTHGDFLILKTLFGTGKDSGAALMMFILGVSGSILCIITGKKLKKYQYNDKHLYERFQDLFQRRAIKHLMMLFLEFH